jgi:hypothetical protein
VAEDAVVPLNLGHPKWVAFLFPLLSLFDRAMVSRGSLPDLFGLPRSRCRDETNRRTFQLRFYGRTHAGTEVGRSAKCTLHAAGA